MTQQPYTKDLIMYCVMCGIDHNDENGLETCPESELKMTHLWAQIGHVQDWFPVKRFK